MTIFLTLAYLFFIGSIIGWIMELLFRRFIAKGNPEKKWINPGFCTGPYLPLYGSGLCVLYLTASVGDVLEVNGIWGKIIIVLLMGVNMTVIEYIAGLISLKFARVRLWDYSDEWGNIKGIICPKFSLLWLALSGIYYIFIHGRTLRSLKWLSENLAFSFVIGLFFGVFIVDVCYNTHIVAEIKKIAEEKQIEVRYENFKAQIKSNHESAKEKSHFLFPFKTTHSLAEHLKETQSAWESRVRELRRTNKRLHK